jgi:hypothetical protein
VLQWSIQATQQANQNAPIMKTPTIKTLGTNPTDATSTSWSARRACTAPFATTYATGFATARATRTYATCVHTKVAIVAWHRAYAPAMHHPRRPEEVASH